MNQYHEKFSEIVKLGKNAEISGPLQNLRRIGLEALVRAINTVLPHNLMNSYLQVTEKYIQIGQDQISRSSFKDILIIGGGKATGNMCQALLDIFQDRFPLKGVINIPYGQAVPSILESPLKKAQVKINFCAHPVPDDAGLQGVQEMLSLIETASNNTLVLALISGGGSALMPYPAHGISLKDVQDVNRLLLDCGASIQEINCVRKHISGFKGGHLARLIAPRKLYSLIISDVIGNDLQTIASGPTVPDHTTFQEAKKICTHYNMFSQLPQSVQERLQLGIEGTIEETPKPGHIIFESTKTIILGSAETSAQSAYAYLLQHEMNPEIFSHNLQGEAQDFGKNLISLISKNESQIPKVLIGTGEFTVTIHGKGTGGRNQEMLLGFLSKLNDNPHAIPNYLSFVVISGAFDGIEGSSPAMGAIIDSESFSRMKKKYLNPDLYLESNDSYRFFRELNDNIITGQTGTNVNDMVLILINPLNSN